MKTFKKKTYTFHIAKYSVYLKITDIFFHKLQPENLSMLEMKFLCILSAQKSKACAISSVSVFF